MKLSVLTICVVAVLWSVVLGPLSIIEAQCTDSGNETCSMSYNRTCFEEDTCSACLPGYIDFLNRTEACYAVDDIDLEAFIQKFNPNFTADDLMPEERREILVAMAQFISEHNAENSDFELAINRFSADTPEEAKQRMGYVYVEGTDNNLDEDQQPTTVSNGEFTFPEKVNWVERGAVTSVKDQGRCGCCWAVAVCGALEGAAAIDSNFTYLQSLSFQQFISCDKENLGCDGGNIVLATEYSMENTNGGTSSLNDYPFSDEEGETTAECKDVDRATTSPEDGRVVVTFQDGRSFEERLYRMKYAISVQPIAMVIKSDCKTLSSYKSGVMTDDGDCRCEDVSCVDHAVLMVGYDDTYDPPYWLLKNSWSTGWGEDGYFRIAQAPYDREWGLFAVLAQGVIPLDVTNTTTQVEDIPQDTGANLANWQIALIAVAGFLVVLICCCCIMKAAKK